METMLVRLKPYDRRRGHVLRTLTYRGMKFVGERGWYRVNRVTADELRTLHQVHGDPLSPRAFDVCTEEEALRMDADEAAANRPVRATDDVPLMAPKRAPDALTTADLPETSATPLAGDERTALRRGRKAQE